MPSPRESLLAVLRLAYSGERAAGYAYRGHWRSLRDAEERDRIRRIEEEEWHHRRLVGEMLDRLGAAPERGREIRALLVGRTLGLRCHLAGWLLPMYGAGRLERRNVGEYEAAARFARRSGHEELVDCLLTMAEVEWDHEAYFRARVLRHPLGRLLVWKGLPSRDSIRAAFDLPPAPEGIPALPEPRPSGPVPAGL
jgi:rubrerythrin